MATEAPAVANVSLEISLSQMLDLALGTPEVGVVNFNLLHHFLHVLLQEINLQTTKVEFRGENADRIKTMVQSLRPEPAPYLQEYSIADDTDKIREGVDVTTGIPLTNKRFNELEEKVGRMEQKLNDLQIIINTLFEDISPTEDTTAEAAETAAAAAEKGETEISDELSDSVVGKVPKTRINEIAARLATTSNIVEISQDVATLKVDVAEIQQELQKITPGVTKVTEDEEGVEMSDAANLKQCLEAVKNVEATHGKTMDDITERVIVLEKEIENLSEKVNVIQGTDQTDGIDINELVTKVQRIEMDIERIGETMDGFFDDKDKKDVNINTLLEEIEILKTVKADKEDLEDALADKADAQAVNRKVSHDQFDAARDDLSRGLEDAINKLTKQESIWQQALDEVQNEVATKVDKVEMTPLKDFVTKKLKSLQEKLKVMAEARREIEAAGTKKLLRDVQCISCDKDVVMKREEIGRFRTEPLPCTTSTKPYLTYKLDQVRKQQRKLPHIRNMIQFEAAMQEEARKRKAKEEILAKTPRDHFCNRYCGGSHTTMTSQQKIMRVEHFLTQWGPQTIQLTDGLIKGKDGKMYRGRLLPEKLDVCGPTCWENQINEETRSSERTPPAWTSFHKTSPNQRNNTGNERRNARKSSKEPRMIFEVAEKPLAQIVEASQMTPSENNVDESPFFIPAGSQDEIVYETNESIGGE